MSNSGRRNHKAKRGNEPIEVLKLETTGTEEEQKFVPIFTIDDKSYDLWVNPPATVGLRYLKEIRLNGADSAAVWLLYQMIGEDGYDALMNFAELKEGHLDQVLKICREHAMGEDGNLGNG
jgi:hypothetical protein